MKKISIYSFLIGIFLFVCYSNIIVKAQTTLPFEKAEIELKINQMVTNLRHTREKSVALNQSIFEKEEQVKTTQQKIENLNAVVNKRKERSLERLRQIQLNDEFNFFLYFLLNSQSISDFIQRIIIMTQLQNEANNQLYLAQQTVNELQQLKEKQQQILNDVTEQHKQLLVEMSAIEQKKKELENVIAQYPDVVEQIIAKNEKSYQEQSTSSTPSSQLVESTTQNVTTIQVTEKIITEPSTLIITHTEKNTQSVTVLSEQLYSIADLKRQGVIMYNGNKFTYYSELVLPGKELKIPGRHVNEQGYVVDGDGYIVLANNAPIGTVVSTPFGALGKVYDRGTFGNHYDVYLR